MFGPSSSVGLVSNRRVDLHQGRHLINCRTGGRWTWQVHRPARRWEGLPLLGSLRRRVTGLLWWLVTTAVIRSGSGCRGRHDPGRAIRQVLRLRSLRCGRERWCLHRLGRESACNGFSLDSEGGRHGISKKDVAHGRHQVALVQVVVLERGR